MTAGTSARPGPAAFSRVKIAPWPHGVLGYVTSPHAGRCAAGRRVAVFKQRGKGHHPRRDRRIATARAHRNHGLYQWSARTREAGRLYAKARQRPGCRTAFSKSIRFAPSTGGGDGGQDYPPCSPYVSEGTSTICEFKLLKFRTRFCPSFGSTEKSCGTFEGTGPYPWGSTPAGRSVDGGFDWNWNNHTVIYFASRAGQSQGAAHLGGTMPGPGSADYTITDAFAQNDQGYPNGDHFYTPNVPGQPAGKVGGPLHLNFIGGVSNGDVEIYGYLYLKR